MPRSESRYPHDWFRVGESELKRARYLLQGGDLVGAGFNLHQAAEKYLKGYLLFKGWELRRIHALDTLLNEAVRHDASFEAFRASALKMNQYYIEERYPFTVQSQLTEAEIRESLRAVESIRDKVEGLVK